MKTTQLLVCVKETHRDSCVFFLPDCRTPCVRIGAPEGGRYSEKSGEKPERYYHCDATDNWNGSTNRDNTLKRRAEHLQRDFAARAGRIRKFHAQDCQATGFFLWDLGDLDLPGNADRKSGKEVYFTHAVESSNHCPRKHGSGGPACSQGRVSGIFPGTG